MKAEIKPLSMMPMEHKKRVFNAWQQMTYETVKGMTRINVFKIATVNLSEISIDIKIYAGCNGYNRAVNDLLKAFIACSVKYSVSYIYDNQQRKYIHIVAKA